MSERIEERYLPLDCPNCGRHRLLYDGVDAVCEKCGVKNWETQDTESLVYVLIEGREVKGVASDELNARRWVESYHPSHGARYEAHEVDDPALELNTLGMTRTAAPAQDIQP